MGIEQALKNTETIITDPEVKAVQRAHWDEAWQIGEAIFARADNLQATNFLTVVLPDHKGSPESVITDSPWFPRTDSSEIKATRLQLQFSPSWLGRVILRKSPSEPYTVGFNLYVRPTGQEFGEVNHAAITLGKFHKDNIRVVGIGPTDPYDEAADIEVIHDLVKIAKHVGADLPANSELAET